MHTAGSDGGGSDTVLIWAVAGGKLVTVILISVGILMIVTRWLYKKHHSDKNSKSSAFDPDTAATVEMDENPSYGIIKKGNNPIRMSSDPLYHLSTDLSDGRQMDEDHSEEAHKKMIVLMEIDPIYQSTIGDGKLYGITDYRREINNENFNYVEPNGVAQINTKVKKHHNDKKSNSLAPKPHGNHNHIDPDQAATDYNPSCGKDNNVKMNSDPPHQLSKHSSDGRKMGEDHKVPSQKGAVQMEIDPIHQLAVRDGKLHGVTNVRREISEQNYNYVEPDEVVQYKENIAKINVNPSTGDDSGNYNSYITIL